MRSQERITSIRKNMRDRVPRENLWYYNESNIPESEPLIGKKTSKFISERTFEEDFAHLPHNFSENIKKKDCLFVVDWQMSEPLKQTKSTSY